MKGLLVFPKLTCFAEVSSGISVPVNQWRLRAVSKSKGVHKVDAIHSSFTLAIVHLKRKLLCRK